jgi:hypothetical protein
MLDEMSNGGRTERKSREKKGRSVGNSRRKGKSTIKKKRLVQE